MKSSFWLELERINAMVDSLSEQSLSSAAHDAAYFTLTGARKALEWVIGLEARTPSQYFVEALKEVTKKETQESPWPR